MAGLKKNTILCRLVVEYIPMEAIHMRPDIPWLKRFEEPKEQPDDDQLEQIDYVTMLEELEFR